MSDLVPRPENWLRVTPAGLYCEPGDFHIDPTRPVPRAVITHGHGDHARPGNEHVLATPETIAIMRQRYGELAGGSLQPTGYGERVALDGVSLSLVPAGHVLAPGTKSSCGHVHCRVRETPSLQQFRRLRTCPHAWHQDTPGGDRLG